MRYLLFITLGAFIAFSCQSGKSTDQAADSTAPQGNPPAEGFNMVGSDAIAIEWADKVMEAMGGRKNWDNTRFITWNFFGRHALLWDKQEGKVRIESPADSLIFLIDIFNDTGKVKKGNVVFEQPDSITAYVERGKRIWINDSYWLVMPFKLKDSGVTLKYLAQDTTQEGTMAEILQLTFEAVGVSPQNKYKIYIDPATNLVCQWDFYSNATDPAPRFSMPWKNYQPHGAILLSGDRGKPQLSDIAVYAEVPAAAFESFDPVNAADLK
ncbi:MAG: hypothetical protein R2828_31120 [Saprospiraceae bacterium]